ncbi:MAG: hypothetical protein ABSG38_16425 [Spirochaetia bacterium]|jgi:hypothetical protein
MAKENISKPGGLGSTRSNAAGGGRVNVSKPSSAPNSGAGKSGYTPPPLPPSTKKSIFPNSGK